MVRSTGSSDEKLRYFLTERLDPAKTHYSYENRTCRNVPSEQIDSDATEDKQDARSQADASSGRD